MKVNSVVCLGGLGVFGNFLAFVNGAAAHVPTYGAFDLQVRANLCANEPQGFNLPCNVFFNSSTPSLNNSGKVAIKLDVIGSSQGVWFGGNQTGGIVYTSPSDAGVSDVWMNNLGYVVFPQTFSAQNGIYFYDSVANTSGLRTTLRVPCVSSRFFRGVCFALAFSIPADAAFVYLGWLVVA